MKHFIIATIKRVLEGIIASHNDNFNIAGNKFLKEITEKIKKLDNLSWRIKLLDSQELI